MKAYHYKGSCHCGNIRFEFQSVYPPGEFQPRACGCSFCKKQGATYISDPLGSLTIDIVDTDKRLRYRQGSRSADFLICAQCGVLTAVTYEKDGSIYAAVNSKAVDIDRSFGYELPVSPEKLPAAEKKARWENYWFANVELPL